METNNNNDDLYKAIIVACVIGIAITLVFVIFMRAEIMSGEGFSELYFNEHRGLPDEMEINNTYNISFTLTNHELETTRYIYEVDSKIDKFRENITLLPGESAFIMISITPTNRGWELYSTIMQEYENKLDILKETLMASESKFGLVIDDVSHRYVPISHKVDRFGYIFHTNLSVDELKERPFNKSYRYEEIGKHKSIYRCQNITVFAERPFFKPFKKRFIKNASRKESFTKEILYLSSNQSEQIYLALRHPFIIKAYRYNEDADKELEIHFWYEVKGKEGLLE